MRKTLIKVGEKEVLIEYLKNPVLIKKKNDMIKYARVNKIKVKGYQERTDEIIKLLNEYRLINVVEFNVYAVAYVLFGDLRTVQDLRSYAREQGLPLSNKMKKENLKNLLIKTGYAVEERGELYKKQGTHRRVLKLRKDLVDFARSYYLYEGEGNILSIIELLLKSKLVDYVEGVVLEKEPPVGPMTPELMKFIAINNGPEHTLGRYSK